MGAGCDVLRHLWKAGALNSYGFAHESDQNVQGVSLSLLPCRIPLIKLAYGLYRNSLHERSLASPFPPFSRHGIVGQNATIAIVVWIQRHRELLRHPLDRLGLVETVLCKEGGLR